MKNVGIIDRLMRLIGLHLMISIADASIIDKPWVLMTLSLTGLYLLITLVIGCDPIYKLFQLDTVEVSTAEKKSI